MRAKQEALTRKEIIEKMEKWVSACEEEGWLVPGKRLLRKTARHRWYRQQHPHSTRKKGERVGERKD